MTSHDYAAKLKALSEDLSKRPQFPVPDYAGDILDHLDYYQDKNSFLTAVKALGAGTKGATARAYTPRISFRPTGALFDLRAEQSALCTLIRPAEYDCGSLLKEMEALTK